MKRFVVSTLLALALAASISALPAFSQENTASANPQGEAAVPAVKEEVTQAKDLSVYGEVQAVNASSGTLSVQYYDYDSDQEKTAEIVVDKDTKIENAAAIDKINKGDWVDVIYVVKDAVNVAKSVIVEKEEPEAPVVEQAAAEAPVE